MSTDVQIPGKAVSDKHDVREPVRALLEDLDLLGTAEESAKAAGFTAAFSGPPQSVALIEAGATAASKWWATGLGASAAALWGAVAAWWPKQDVGVKEVVVGGALLVTATLVIAIGYLIASDVRGRAAAATALIQARARLAAAMIVAAEAVYTPEAPDAPAEIIPLPGKLHAKNLLRRGDDEDGWVVLALERQANGELKYILVKGSVEARVPAADLEIHA